MVELEFESKQFDSFQALNHNLSLMVEFYRDVIKRNFFQLYIFLGNCLNNLQIFTEYLPQGLFQQARQIQLLPRGNQYIFCYPVFVKGESCSCLRPHLSLSISACSYISFHSKHKSIRGDLKKSIDIEIKCMEQQEIIKTVVSKIFKIGIYTLKGVIM